MDSRLRDINHYRNWNLYWICVVVFINDAITLILRDSSPLTQCFLFYVDCL